MVTLARAGPGLGARPNRPCFAGSVQIAARREASLPPEREREKRALYLVSGDCRSCRPRAWVDTHASPNWRRATHKIAHLDWNREGLKIRGKGQRCTGTTCPKMCRPLALCSSRLGEGNSRDRHHNLWIATHWNSSSMSFPSAHGSLKVPVMDCVLPFLGFRV
jgi:hypothetical protein